MKQLRLRIRTETIERNVSYAAQFIYEVVTVVCSNLVELMLAANVRDLVPNDLRLIEDFQPTHFLPSGFSGGVFSESNLTLLIKEVVQGNSIAIMVNRRSLYYVLNSWKAQYRSNLPVTVDSPFTLEVYQCILESN